MSTDASADSRRWDRLLPLRLLRDFWDGDIQQAGCPFLPDEPCPKLIFVQSFDFNSLAETRIEKCCITIAQAHEQTGNASGVVDGQACVYIPGILQG